MALQNEPLNENPGYPTQHMDPVQEAQLAAILQPLLSKGGRKPLLLGYEHNWNNLDYPSALLAESARITPKGSGPLFAGISFHCYAGDESAQLAFLRAHPDTGIWFTECSGTNRTSFDGDLLWQAQHLLLGAPLNGARSVLLWNLVLNSHGGPHNGGCGDCRALFTVEPHGASWSIHRNVEYYEMAHAAPFVHPGAVRVAAMASVGHEIETVGFRNPDGTLVLLVLNSAPRGVRLSIQSKGRAAAYIAPARSLLTFTWGVPVPTLTDGTYRLCTDAAGDRCLEAVSGTQNLSLRPASTDVEAAARQLWTLHRLADGRFEIRNVATAQSLALAAGKLATITVDAGHVVPLSLHPQGDEICVGAVSGYICTPVATGNAEAHSGNLLHLLAAQFVASGDMNN